MPAVIDESRRLSLISGAKSQTLHSGGDFAAAAALHNGNTSKFSSP